MTDRMKKMWKIFVPVFVLAGMVWLIMGGQMETYTFEKTGITPANPMTGFAPMAQDDAADGENTLVYVGVTWRELEPEEGGIDFAAFEEKYRLQHFREAGKKIVFRFVMDVPGDEEHMDIPDWLYEKTGDGTFYSCEYGKGYSPNYSHPVLRNAYARTIAALGKEYGGDHFFCFIEMGTIGHWGEWHVNTAAGIRPMPGAKICKEYITAFENAFPNAKILTRRPYALAGDAGVYNDVTGNAEATAEWLGWIQNGGAFTEGEEDLPYRACGEIWKTAPVGGEMTSAIQMEQMLGEDLEETLRMIRESHMTFLGPKFPEGDSEAVEKIRSSLGYRYGVSKVTVKKKWLSRKTVLTAEVFNDGAAPMYEDWKLCVYIESEAKITRVETDADLRSISGGKSQSVRVELSEPLADDARIRVGIEDPESGKPAVYLDMQAEEKDRMYRIR